MKVELIPLDKIIIEDKWEIPLGDERKKVIELLGRGHEQKEYGFWEDYYFGSELVFFYDKRNRVNRITVELYDAIEIKKCMVFGKQIKNTRSKEVIEFLKTFDKSIDKDYGEGEAYLFQNLKIDLWKDFSVEDIQEMIKEAKEEGEYEELRETFDENLRKAQCFTNISINTPKYFLEISGMK